jgi:hypothetical protein
MIKIGLSSLAEIEGQELLDENERLKSLPQFEVTPDIQKGIHQTVQREFLRKSLHRASQGIYKVVNRVAVVFLAVTILFSSTMIASADFRDAIYKLMFTHAQRYTQIELDNRTDLEFVDSDIYTWDHAFAPTVMPQGYVVEDVLDSTLIHVVIYTHENGGEIKFLQNDGRGESTLRVDSEDAQLVQTVFINDSEGILVNKDGLNTLVWRIGDSILSLASNENNETLMDIAKGIKLIH